VILLDASIWIDHIHSADRNVSTLLEDGNVLCHPFVIGEVGLGDFRGRHDFLDQLRRLPVVEIASDNEVMTLIESHHLFGRGIGYVDAHLLAAVFLTPNAKLWTRDKRLKEAAIGLKLAADRLL
jgi:predicted nucleic acid-binding protein